MCMLHRLGATARVVIQRDAAHAGLMALGLAYYYFVPSPLLSLPGLLLFAVAAWRRTTLALCLLPLTFPFWYVPKQVMDHRVLPLSEIALVLCVVILLLQWTLAVGPGGVKTRLRRSGSVLAARVGWSLGIGALLFALGLVLGVVVARRHPEALRAFRWELAEPLVYFVLLILSARGERWARWLAAALLASAVFLALLALLQVTLWHVTFTPLAAGNVLVPYEASSGGALRATGIYFGSSNSLGALLERALPFAVALIVVRSAARPLVRLVALGGVLLFVVTLIASGSRGAEVGAAVGCLLVVLVALSRWWVAALTACALALALLWQRDGITRELIQGHGGTGEVRTLVWRAAWHMALDHPLVGIGPDQFLYYYSSRYTNHPYWIPYENGHPTPALYQPNLAQPHNLPLELWLIGGLLAVGGFALMLYDLARRSLSVWHREAGVGWRAALALAAAGSLAAGLVHGMVDSAYFAPDLALDFWLIAALLVILSRGGRRKRVAATSGQ